MCVSFVELLLPGFLFVHSSAIVGEKPAYGQQVSFTLEAGDRKMKGFKQFSGADTLLELWPCVLDHTPSRCLCGSFVWLVRFAMQPQDVMIDEGEPSQGPHNLEDLIEYEKWIKARQPFASMPITTTIASQSNVLPSCIMFDRSAR